MALQIKYDPQLNLVEIIFAGEVISDELRGHILEACAMGRKEKTNLYLCDASKCTFKVDLLHVMNVERIQVGEKLDRNARIAVLEPVLEEDQDLVAFYETVCKNRGWMVQLFKQREQAIKWLLE